MSLFKSREWWSTIVGADEEFDTGCLCVANIDNRADDGDKIIVGSFHGYVRIYRPCPTKTETGWSGFRPEDVLCETQLPNPVLQVAAGRFMLGSESLHLAVLQPRNISVYTVVGSRGQVEHGSQYALKLEYEHKLRRTAANFCHGPFGGIKDKDFLCVQSMDGTVSVFEQESFAFCRFLPGALLPGPLCYVPRTDSFVTVSSARQVESYKYQVLAVATDAKTKEESQTIKSGKKVATDWTLNIGEEARDMKVVAFDNTPSSILILGERSLFIMSDTGKLRFIKKFDFNPSCFLPYASLHEGTISTVIGTHTRTLLVHEDITVKWAAQLPFVPLQICTGNFSSLRGVLVTLDEAGHLQAVYLGTDPALFAPPAVVARDIDYAQQDAEMKELQKVIREQQSKHAVPMPKGRSEDDVEIIVSVNPDLDAMSLAEDVELEDEDGVPSLTVRLQLRARVPVCDVRLMVHAPPPLAASQNLAIFPCLNPGSPVEIQVSFFLQRSLLPSGTGIDITTSFLSPEGAPRVVEAHVPLPLKLLVKPCLPVKNAMYKLTLDTNKPPINLNDIFPDLLGDNEGGPGNALGFQIYGGPVITVLASKSSQRYRLQCDVFPALWLLLHEMELRLAAFHRRLKVTDFKVTYEGALPLQEYFDVLDHHFECRVQEEAYRALLAERASQFRAIQRRLLTRYKDKTPAPLLNLDTLLDGTYRQLLALADKSEENLEHQRQRAAGLSAATRLLNLLIRLWCGLTDEATSVLEAAITPTVTEHAEQGWEEIVDAAVTHLLRTCLARNTKDATLNPAPLVLLKDTAKLKKHIALLCDRLSKGAILSPGQDPGAEVAVRMATAPGAARRGGVAPLAPGLGTGLDEEDESRADTGPGQLGEAEVPLGSSFGENKSPRSQKAGARADVTPHAKPGLPAHGACDSVESVPDLDNLGSAEGDGRKHTEKSVFAL